MTLNQILYFRKVARLEKLSPGGRGALYFPAIPEPFDGRP